MKNSLRSPSGVWGIMKGEVLPSRTAGIEKQAVLKLISVDSDRLRFELLPFDNVGLGVVPKAFSRSLLSSDEGNRQIGFMSQEFVATLRSKGRRATKLPRGPYEIVLVFERIFERKLVRPV